ncbi:hypothetical protein K458DRAFT_371472, partial [Lentithecium fluviatile CBS 122367]
LPYNFSRVPSFTLSVTPQSPPLLRIKQLQLSSPASPSTEPQEPTRATAQIVNTFSNLLNSYDTHITRPPTVVFPPFQQHH